MNLPGIRTVLKAADTAIGETVAEITETLNHAAADIPLVGLSAQRMHDIEQKGLALASARWNDLKNEIARLEAEAASTFAIMEASGAKLLSLKNYLGIDPALQPDKPEVPIAVHTDIQAGTIEPDVSELADGNRCLQIASL